MTYDTGEKPPRRLPTPPSYVYFVQAEVLRLIKIGVALRPDERLSSLQCGSPDHLSIIGRIKTDHAAYLERRLHKRFASARRHGEWFEASDELLAYIRENAELHDDAWAVRQAALANAAYSRIC